MLGACFVVTGFAYGFPKAVSVFFRALMRDFGAGYSDTAWVSSIMLAMLYGTGQAPWQAPPPQAQGRGRDPRPAGHPRETTFSLWRRWPQRGEERAGADRPVWPPCRAPPFPPKTYTRFSYRWGNRSK